MLSKETKKLLMKTGVAVTVGLSTVMNPAMKEPVVVEASTLVNQTQGELTVVVSSIWTYSSADWNARSKVYPKGTKFQVTAKYNVSGSYMYRLDNGLYISANPSYVTFTAKTAAPQPAPTVPTAPAGTQTAKTTANLNLRSGASTGSSILLTIPKGSQVTVLSASGGWSQVTYNGRNGYVSSTYLGSYSAAAPAPTPTPTPPAETPGETVTTTRTTTTANLNLRSSASTSAGILLTIPKGSAVSVLKVSGGWTNVTYNGRTGWVSNTYLKTETVTTTKPTTPTTPPPAPVEPPPAPVEPAPTPTPEILGTAKTTANLNLRSGASTSTSILLTIPKGSTVSVLKVSGSWTNVTYRGKTGWVSNAYLTALVPTVPPVTEPPVTEPPAPETPPVAEKKPQVLLLENLKSVYTNEDITISGRALSHDGIVSVTVKVDGQNVAVTRTQRTDLNSLYSEGYVLDNIGFVFTISKTPLAPGSHTLEVVSTGKDGEVKKVTTSFVLEKPQPVVTLNGLTDGASVPGAPVTISGTAQYVEGITTVKYYINGVLKGTTPGASYSFSLAPDQFSSTGMNTLSVEAVGSDGTVYRKGIVLRGTGTENYISEQQAKTRDAYAVLESRKGVGPKVNNKLATIREIEYYLDPSNYIHSTVDRYMFLDLKYTAGQMSLTAEDLNLILAGKGVLDGKGQAFLDGANQYGVNPFYLITHAIHETGHGTSTLAKGQLVTDTYTKFGDASTIVIYGLPEDQRKIAYNVFGIGAWDVDANYWGAQRAYAEGWFSVEEAIVGGAKWISQNYINRKINQNTLYKMRFNLPENMEHEYATDLGWAIKQASRLKAQMDAYVEKGGKGLTQTFIFPTFGN